jgi:hypothetical protein
MAHQAPGCERGWGPFFSYAIGHPSHALKNPAAKPHLRQELRRRIRKASSNPSAQGIAQERIYPR